ncbi:MAG: TadE/TadG family type IV pilus assembly protein [Gammaproteobacteria bacterium]
MTVGTRQRGTTTVEFALIGVLFFIVLFGIIEFGRLLFTWNTLTEMTRRGARVAAVCHPIDHAAQIRRATVFRDPASAGPSPYLLNLTPNEVQVDYLNEAGDETDPAALSTIFYVRVSITDDTLDPAPGYQHEMLIPTFGLTPTSPPFATTIPSESLGLIPGGATQCPFG